MGQHGKRISFLEAKKYTRVINVSGNKKKKCRETTTFKSTDGEDFASMLAKHETFLKVQNFHNLCYLLPFFLNLYFFNLFYLFNVHIYSATHVNIKSIVKKKV